MNSKEGRRGRLIPVTIYFSTKNLDRLDSMRSSLAQLEGRTIGLSEFVRQTIRQALNLEGGEHE